MSPLKFYFVMSFFSKYLSGLMDFYTFGLFSNFNKGYASGSGNFLDKLFGNLLTQVTGTGLTDAQKEANAFSSDEAAKDRAFQEMQRTTQFQTAVKDMQAAGVNPALIYGGSGTTAGTTGGASASSVSPSSGGASALLSLISSLASTSVQNRSLEMNYDIERRKLGLQQQDLWLRENIFDLNSKIGESQIKVNEAQAIVLNQNLKVMQSEIRLNSAKIQKIIREKGLIVSQTDLNNSMVLLNKLESDKRAEVIEASLNYTNSMAELNKLGAAELVVKIKNAKTSGEILEIQKQTEDENLKMLIQRAATYKEFLDATILKIKNDAAISEAQRKWMGFNSVVNGVSAVSEAAYDWVSYGAGVPRGGGGYVSSSTRPAYYW